LQPLFDEVCILIAQCGCEIEEDDMANSRRGFLTGAGEAIRNDAFGAAGSRALTMVKEALSA
jgi:hypothetical protein